MVTGKRSDALRNIEWPLRLSADCLRFIGPYRRVEGFNVDALMLFEGVRKAG